MLTKRGKKLVSVVTYKMKKHAMRDGKLVVVTQEGVDAEKVQAKKDAEKASYFKRLKAKLGKRHV